MDELWGASCEYLWENQLCYNSTTLYVIFNHFVVSDIQNSFREIIFR